MLPKLLPQRVPLFCLSCCRCRLGLCLGGFEGFTDPLLGIVFSGFMAPCWTFSVHLRALGCSLSVWGFFCFTACNVASLSADASPSSDAEPICLIDASHHFCAHGCKTALLPRRLTWVTSVFLLGISRAFLLEHLAVLKVLWSGGSSHASFPPQLLSFIRPGSQTQNSSGCFEGGRIGDGSERTAAVRCTLGQIPA